MIWMDGKFYAKEDAKVSVYDHGLLYGDGTFEGLRIYNDKIFKQKAHTARLYRSAQVLGITIPYTPEQLDQATLETVQKNGLSEGYIRIIVTRGKGDLGLDPQKCKKATVIIIADTIQLYPQEFYQEGIPIVTAATRRLPSDGLDPRVKSLNYLNNILAKIEAKQAGCMEALMLNQQGYVSECTADNIFVVKEGTVLTPATFYGALEGITRETILELLDPLGIPYKETALTRYDIYTAQECFMTGSGAEIMPVKSCDGRIIRENAGPITNKIREAFKKLVQG